MGEPLEYFPLDSDVAEYLKKSFPTPLRSAYIKCKGCVMSKGFKEVGDIIRQMEVRDDDIWMCSFPKSGTTWTQEMIWCLGNNLDFKTAREKLIQFFFPNTFFHTRYSAMCDHEAEVYVNNPKLIDLLSFTQSIETVINLPSPRFIKTHLPFNLLPEKLQNNSTKAKMIYITRNPRDVCISYYHHARLFEGYSVDFEAFCDIFLKGYVCYAPYWNNVLQFYEQKNDKNLLILCYKDLQRDLKSIINKVANFMRIIIDEEGIEKLLDHLSFDNMKLNKAVNYDSIIERIKSAINNDETGSFFRSGKVGEWKNRMESPLLERFKIWEDENLKTD